MNPCLWKCLIKRKRPKGSENKDQGNIFSPLHGITDELQIVGNIDSSPSYKHQKIQSRAQDNSCIKTNRSLEGSLHCEQGSKHSYYAYGHTHVDWKITITLHKYRTRWFQSTWFGVNPPGACSVPASTRFQEPGLQMDFSKNVGLIKCSNEENIEQTRQKYRVIYGNGNFIYQFPWNRPFFLPIDKKCSLSLKYLLLCSVLISRSAKNAPPTPHTRVLARWRHHVWDGLSISFCHSMSVVHNSYTRYGATAWH